jgi:hypothetical protein
MPEERPGTLPGRSSCVPCGRSLRLSSPGDAPMHQPQLNAKDSVALMTPALSVAVT